MISFEETDDWWFRDFREYLCNTVTNVENIRVLIFDISNEVSKVRQPSLLSCNPLVRRWMVRLKYQQKCKVTQQWYSNTVVAIYPTPQEAPFFLTVHCIVYYNPISNILFLTLAGKKETSTHSCAMSTLEHGFGYDDLDEIQKNPIPLDFEFEILKVCLTYLLLA